MTSLNRGMWLGAALIMAACGSTGGDDGGATCSSTAQCTGTNVVCHLDTQTCGTKCESAGDCSAGALCEATTGQCYKNTVNDAGTDAGVDGGTNPTTCNASGIQPDVCGHTNVCNSANECQPVTDGTCGNVTSAPSSTHTPFTSASTGAVIFNIVAAGSGANDDAFCQSGTNAFTGTIYAYAPVGSTFGAASGSLPAGLYFKSDGSSETITGKFRPSGYEVIANTGGKLMSLKVTLCASNSSSLEAAFGFANGNAACVTLTR